MHKFDSNRLLLYGSILAFLYFIALLFISIINLNVTIINAIAELLTIPFILLLIFITIFSAIKISREKLNADSPVFKGLLLSILTIVLLILATIFE